MGFWARCPKKGPSYKSPRISRIILEIEIVSLELGGVLHSVRPNLQLRAIFPK